LAKRILAMVVLVLFILLMVNLFTLRIFPVFSASVYGGVFVYYILFMAKKNHTSNH
jgi:uncharacterized PurR-regulated membrane protein YhhQ (DUF165 family)